MNKSIVAAWVVGEGIIIYRVFKKDKRPVMPGEILASSGLFILLALLAEPQPQFASLLAWGFDIAAFLNLAPSVLTGQAASASPQITKPSSGQPVALV